MSIFNHLKLNWHFINKCNMQCKFCYSSKESCKDITFDVIPKLSLSKKLILSAESLLFTENIFICLKNCILKDIF